MSTADLCKILPNLFRRFTFSFPLLTNNLGNVRIVQTRMAGNDSLLMMLPIKDKCYKEVSGWGTAPANKECTLYSFRVTPPSAKESTREQRNHRLTISRAGYLRFWLAKTNVWREFRRSI
jgi:hypothetical protein